MRLQILLLSLGLFLTACGVKAPPVAPERHPKGEPLHLNCSVYDPTCDEKDPHYDPSKDPAKQKTQESGQ